MSPVAAPVPGPLNFHSSDVQTSSFQVAWDHSANDIVLYRLSWAPFSGGDTMEVSARNPVTEQEVNHSSEQEVATVCSSEMEVSTYLQV